ncbi:MAG: DUF262 domain-containing protein [Muribaculaceae bacterium]|nr:DUF262 domain-containing protein [Muribaculaceae bacterium]
MANDFGKMVVSQIKGIFRIPSYQRGYRWTSDEIVRLLDDVYEHKENQNSYYLQPIVVKRLSATNIAEEDCEYELIDGQQRLTTLFLIISSLKEWLPKVSPKYSISYDTRDSSWDYINSLLSDTKKAEQEKDKYIDFRYLYNAYKTIQEWLNNQEDPSSVCIELYKLLSDKVKVLWYEVDNNENGHKLFKRLNIGRIPLTNAELIKALFLNRNSLKTIRSDKNLNQNEIALLWERMEQELRNPEFWSFLTNVDANKYPTRIELIVDLMSKKKKNERDKYFTFFYFNDLITKNNKSIEELWDDILFYFDTLKVWFQDRELYNRAGCLVLLGERISNLIEETKHLKKTERLSTLEEKIRNRLVKKDEILSLRYGSDNTKIKNVLIWFNIKTMDNSGERFPFNRFKEAPGWSLEHIHAQNSEGLYFEKERHNWLEKQFNAFDALPQTAEIDEIKEDVKNAIAKETIGGDLFSDLFKRITSLFSANLADDDLNANMHSIKNLALLKTDANAALNNSVFEVKRHDIAQLDKQGYFIPVCTRNVFTKYYSPAGENQPYLWTDKDRDAYYDEILNTVYS